MITEPISAVIITLNEESIIERCIRSLQWCKEVVIVDSGSTDATVAICRSMGCRVIEHTFTGFGAQKAFAVEQATNNWVFSIDADEVASADIEAHIANALQDPHMFAYRIPRRFFFLGKKFSHGRGSCDYPIRLFHRDKAHFSRHIVHEHVIADGAVGIIQSELEHHSYVSISQYLQKFDRYTSLASVELRKHHRNRSIPFTAFQIPLYFLKHYVLNGHWRNGSHGLLWSVLSSIYPLVKVAKAQLDTDPSNFAVDNRNRS